MPPLIELINVHREFDGGRIVAVDDVSLRIDSHETVAIVGRSGSGKSTILNLICGLDHPTSGEVRYEGNVITGRAAWASLRTTCIGIVFQNFSLIQTLSARENIEVALLGSLNTARQRRERALELLAHFGLAARSTLRPALLSGGERQRLAIARALANRPGLLVADEPTGNLDEANTHTVMDIFGNIHRDFGTTVLVVTHDEEVAATFPRRIEVCDGRIRSDRRTPSAENSSPVPEPVGAAARP
jgi:putative ABC transport system ATP-binding protein